MNTTDFVRKIVVTPLLLAVLSVCALCQAVAQEITVELFEQKIILLQDRVDVDPSKKGAMLAEYKKVKALLEHEAQHRAKAEENRKRVKQAPTELKQLQKQLKKPVKTAADTVGDATDENTLDRALKLTEAELIASSNELEQLEQERERRAVRQAEIISRKSAIRTRVAALGRELVSAGAAAAADEALAARKDRSAAERQALSAELELLESVEALHEMEHEVLPLRLNAAARKVKVYEAKAKELKERLSKARKQEVKEHAETVFSYRSLQKLGIPELDEVFVEHKHLLDKNSGANGVLARTERADEQLLQLKRDIRELRVRSTNLWRRINISQSSKKLGGLFRELYQTLPSANSLRHMQKHVQTEMFEASLAKLSLDEHQEELRDKAQQETAILESAQLRDIVISADTQQQIREFLAEREKMLRNIYENLEAYVNKLVEHDQRAKEYRQMVEDSRYLIQQHILWVRSVGGSLIPKREHLSGAVLWLFNPQDWRKGLSNCFAELHEFGLAALSIVGLLLLLLVFRKRLNQRLPEYERLTAQLSTDSAMHTLRVGGIAVLSALPLPLFVWAVGTLLSHPIGQPESVLSTGIALRASAMYLLFFLLLYEAFRPHGLGEAHHGWPSEVLRAVRLNLCWFLPLGFICLALEQIFIEQANQDFNNSLGRTAFVGGMLVFSLFLYRIFKDLNFFTSNGEQTSSGNWLGRSRKVWAILLVAGPLVFAFIALCGYYYTSVALFRKLHFSMWVLVLLLFADAFFTRWLRLVRLKAIILKAKARQDADQEQREEAASFEDKAVSLPELDSRTRALFRSILTLSLVGGLYLLWSDVIPALTALERVHLWPRLEVVDQYTAKFDRVSPEITVAAAGAAQQSAGPLVQPPGLGPPLPTAAAGAALSADTQSDPVSLFDVVLVVVLLVLIVLGTRNLPALIDIVLLSQLRLDAGARYAARALTQYTLVFIGLWLALGIIGIQWSNVQWLVAALTFGLAFGLQEIFANFIAGVIVLFERPIRVGDVVTIGSISGTVSRIRMRATTIVDWDRKELIIPNKEFVTGQIINWSLSDATLRLTVRVGVAYGSDTTLAERLLYEVADEHPKVLDQPKPEALFREFGDSSLNFELRCFVKDGLERLIVMHALNKAIDQKFREHSIEIAFPQRDLHLRSSDVALSEALVANVKP